MQDGLFVGKVIFAGLVDGRNVWASDFNRTSSLLKTIADNVAEVVVQPSCSLLHVPVTTKNETDLDPVLKKGIFR